MLTLVAAVLVYDLAFDVCEARSSIVETEESSRLNGAPESRRDKSWTRLENDILSGLDEESLTTNGTVRWMSRINREPRKCARCDNYDCL